MSTTHKLFALVNQKTGVIETKFYNTELGAKRAQGRLNSGVCPLSSMGGCGCKLDLVAVTVTVEGVLRVGSGPAPVQEEIPGTEAPAAPVEG